MLPPQAFGDDRARQEATVVAAARPTVAVASLTAARALASLGIAPDRVAGGDNPLVATPRHRSALREALRRTAAARTDAIAVLPYLPGLSPDEASSHRATDPQGVAAEVRALWEDGVRVFVEVGPGQALTAEVERTLAGAPHLAVATDQPGEHGLHALLDAVARMAVAGVPVDLAALHTGRGSRPERWDDPPKPAAWIVNGHRARAATGASLPKGLRPATETPAIHLGMGKEPAAPNGVSTPRTSPVDDQVTHDMALLTEYLRMVHGIAATSSRLLRGGLDGGPAAVGTGAPEPGPGVG
jgi:hypothetical protein